MKTSSENKFEKSWQDAFSNASMPPPPDMWDRISNELDGTEKVTPLFVLWGLPMHAVSGIAAALILAVGGLFLFNGASTSVEGIVKNQPAETIRAEGSEAEVVVTDDGTPTEAESPQTNATVQQPTVRKEPTVFLGGTTTVSLKVESNAAADLSADDKLLTNNVFDEPPATMVAETTPQKHFLSGLVAELKVLSGRGFDRYATRFTMNRNKLAYEMPQEESTVTKLVKRRSWIGVISGLSPFKPNFQSADLNSVALDYSNAFLSNRENIDVTKIPAIANGANSGDFESYTGAAVQQFNNGRAINVGIQGGRELTKNLSIETGVRYLQGNTDVISNVYSLNENTGELNAFYQDYLLSNSGFKNAVVAPRETINTEYQYLMVPVQMAYKVPIARKLNVEVVGGLSADMFLKYKIASESMDDASFDASNSSLRTLGVSGLGGVRLNYTFDEKWEVSVGSAFQKAMVSNFKAGTSATLRPQTLGINYGVNYHF